ncbi:MAG TPA: FHA domain-containing protein, partial [Roseiflexaceae bacterium]|nr:FHA domain-containing protein [Roseiflexaceae bacterium]
MSLGLLEVVQEGRRQEIVITKGLFTIGRADDNDLVLNDRAVSKYHARLVYNNRGWKVFDLGSANGTYVDGERLFTLDSRQIEDGGSIRIGSVYIVLRTQIQAASEPTAEDRAVLDEMASILAQEPPADATPAVVAPAEATSDAPAAAV